MADLDQLARRLDELERRSAAAEQERDTYRALYLEMMERCRKLERGLLGQATERLPKNEQQLSLDILGHMLDERDRAAIEELQTEEVRGHKRRKPTGRKPIPDDLPRVDIEILPPEVEREGLDAFERVGEEVSEVLERGPASVVVARIVRPKFVRKDRDREATEFLIGTPPTLPIERGLAGAGFLSDTLVRRWQDHLPLNRLEDVYRRDGLSLARSTICNWHMQLASLAEPLIAAMRADAFAQPYLCTDATGVLVQAKDKCRRAHFWVMVAPEKHVLFEYTRDHTNDAVDSILAGYEGYLVADAHVVYDHLYDRGDVVEVNCWAHARRYFFKALGSDPERARAALGMIGMLFKVERSIATAPRKKRERIRHKHSKPVVERFFAWCEEEWPNLLESTPIYDGVRYARNQRKGLCRFLDDGRLPLDNNVSERELRRQAVGRKNWIFVGSDDGARANSVFTSLLASCRMLGLEPWSYLRDLLCLLPEWPVHRVLELAPAYWEQTAAREDVQALLAANPFRRLTLDRG
ncbi:MAG: IS66 family transposase [Deltaproteobacteria bacterium]